MCLCRRPAAQAPRSIRRSRNTAVQGGALGGPWWSQKNAEALKVARISNTHARSLSSSIRPGMAWRGVARPPTHTPKPGGGRAESRRRRATTHVRFFARPWPFVRAWPSRSVVVVAAAPTSAFLEHARVLYSGHSGRARAQSPPHVTARHVWRCTCSSMPLLTLNYDAEAARETLQRALIAW